MLALDLFCGAGGASKGLNESGFEVVGIDIERQPNYPFQLILADALRPPVDISRFDFIWASPPCQSFTAYKRRRNHVRERPNLIPQTRRLLQATGKPFCIENVPGAPLENPIQLCGSSFGLNIRRHRIFECNFQVRQIPCDHEWQTPRFPPATNRTNLRRTVEIGVWRIPLATQQAAMGIDWMALKELSESIPPAYSRHIGNTVAMLIGY